ncbi:unnamed protein product [Closterium sp. Naga37s-1]|nr:unnamed protein product [Closterium sp. Naga37s-1]
MASDGGAAGEDPLCVELPERLAILPFRNRVLLPGAIVRITCSDPSRWVGSHPEAQYTRGRQHMRLCYACNTLVRLAILPYRNRVLLPGAIVRITCSDPSRAAGHPAVPQPHTAAVKGQVAHEDPLCVELPERLAILPYCNRVLLPSAIIRITFSDPSRWVESQRLAILPYRNRVLLPGAIVRITCSDPSSVRLVEQELWQKEKPALIGIVPVIEPAGSGDGTGSSGAAARGSAANGGDGNAEGGAGGTGEKAGGGEGAADGKAVTRVWGPAGPEEVTGATAKLLLEDVGWHPRWVGLVQVKVWLSGAAECLQAEGRLGRLDAAAAAGRREMAPQDGRCMRLLRRLKTRSLPPSFHVPPNPSLHRGVAG